MTGEAHLLLRISKRSGRVRYADILSERYATEVDADGVWTHLMSERGRDFEQARRRLLRKVGRSHHAWALRFLRRSVIDYPLRRPQAVR